MTNAVAKTAWQNRITGYTDEAPGDLLPHPQNPKQHPRRQVEALDGALTDLGWLMPVVVNDETGHVLDGHARIALALERGETTVPVAHVSLPAALEAEALVTIDPIGGLATLDEQRLAALLAEVQTGDAALLALFRELGQVPLPSRDDPGAQVDRAAELQAKWQTARGQLWAIGRHRLLCGDSTDAGDVARLMGGERAALCFTSPPYGQQRDYEDRIADWDELMRGVFGIVPLDADGQVLVNLGLVHRDGEWQPYWDDWLEWMRAEGWRRFGWYVWDQGHGLPGDWNGRLAPSHEFIFHLNRKSVQPNKIVRTKPESLDRAIAKKRGAAQGKKQQGLRNADGSISELTSLDKTGQLFKIPDSVVRIVREQARGVHTQGHPAVFPDELPAFIYDTFSDRNDAVYEPFCGSGTSIVAAEQTSRNCYGMEIEPSYCAVILERLAGMGLAPQREA